MTSTTHFSIGPRGLRALRTAAYALSMLLTATVSAQTSAPTVSPSGTQGGPPLPSRAATEALSAADSANRSPALTRQPVRMVSSGRPLSEMQRQLELSLGARLVLVGQAADAVMQGEIAGSDGLSFVKDLAARMRLEWALGRNEVFLAPEGSGRPTTFATPSPDIATAVAARANQEFEPLGSGIRVVARKEEVVVTGLPTWVTQVASLRMPAMIEQAQASEASRQRARRRGQPVDERPEEPMALEVFRLNNAYVDDKRLAVGSNTLVIPGVARLFRQFTGMAGGASDSVRPAPGGAADTAFGRVERMERLDALSGGRSLRNEADRADGAGRSQDRGLSRAERAELAQDESDLAAGRLDQIANMPAVIADSRMNALVVRDKPSRMEMHRALIKVLDQAADMVQLDAFVIDIKANRLAEFGLGLSWAGNASITSPRFAPGGNSLAESANVILQGTRGAQLLANIRALESKGDSEMLTVPSVVTLNNLEATFSARESFFVRVAGNQDASLSRVTAETLLKVTPLVSGEGAGSQDRRIRLLISVQDGAVDAGTSAVVDNLPRTLENQISTQAVVRGGDTLVIGGQVVRKRVGGRAGLPVIGQIPILGDILGSRSNEMAQFIRIYVVRPRLLGEDSSFAGNAVPLPQEDPFSHPRMGLVRNMMLGSSITPNRPDAPSTSGAPEVNREAPAAAPRETPPPEMTTPVKPQSMLVPAPLSGLPPSGQPDDRRATPR